MSRLTFAEALIVECEHIHAERVQRLEGVNVAGQIRMPVRAEENRELRKRRCRRGWSGNPPPIQSLHTFIGRVETNLCDGKSAVCGDGRCIRLKCFRREESELPLALIKEQADGEIERDAGSRQDAQDCLDQPAPTDDFRVIELMGGILMRCHIAVSWVANGLCPLVGRMQILRISGHKIDSSMRKGLRLRFRNETRARCELPFQVLHRVDIIAAIISGSTRPTPTFAIILRIDDYTGRYHPQ